MKWIEVKNELPIDYARYLCERMNDLGQCYIEEVCLFDPKNRKWYFMNKEVDVIRWTPLPDYMWISVNDRMPEPISMVLIATNFDTKPWMAYYVNDWYILSLEGNGPVSEFKSNLEITHWMALPNLPKP